MTAADPRGVGEWLRPHRPLCSAVTPECFVSVPHQLTGGGSLGTCVLSQSDGLGTRVAGQVWAVVLGCGRGHVPRAPLSADSIPELCGGHSSGLCEPTIRTRWS